MKMPMINLLIQNDSKQNLTNNLPQSNKFEAMLEDNAYYRNHQTHWEKSELKFEQRILEKNDHLESIDQSKITNEKADEPITQHQEKSYLQVEENIQELQYESVFPSMDMQIESSEQPHIKNQNLSGFLNELKRFIEEMPQAESPEINSSEKHWIEFSNHQLFINKQKSTLSLQSSSLSKQDVKSLIDAVKKLLKQKKITLEHVLINGERYD